MDRNLLDHLLVVPRALPALALCLLAACGASGSSRDPQADAAARARLLQPFQPKRQAVCDELEIDLSAEFFAELTRPAHLERKPGTADLATPDLYTVVNDAGMARPIDMAVGNLTFAVLNKATLRVHPAQPARLDLSARGNVDLVTETGQRVPMAELTISQGQERRSAR